jgi:rhodanese-related sulfurtransferase
MYNRDTTMALLSRRNLTIFGAGLLALGGIGYSLSQVSDTQGVTYAFMTVPEMQADNALVVDIRTPPEWSQTGVIEGARLVTFQDAQSFLAQVGPDLADGRNLILICHSGNRSSRAAQALAGKIPNHIISISGGMAREIAQGYRTVAPS